MSDVTHSVTSPASGSTFHRGSCASRHRPQPASPPQPGPARALQPPGGRRPCLAPRLAGLTKGLIDGTALRSPARPSCRRQARRSSQAFLLVPSASRLRLAGPAWSCQLDSPTGRLPAGLAAWLGLGPLGIGADERAQAATSDVVVRRGRTAMLHYFSTTITCSGLTFPQGSCAFRHRPQPSSSPQPSPARGEGIL